MHINTKHIFFDSFPVVRIVKVQHAILLKDLVQQLLLKRYSGDFSMVDRRRILYMVWWQPMIIMVHVGLWRSLHAGTDAKVRAAAAGRRSTSIVKHYLLKG